MLNLKNLFRTKVLELQVSKAQKELLELLLLNKDDFDQWCLAQPSSKIRFQFFYPSAIDFYYDEFKLFNSFFRKDSKGEICLFEFKMSEVNYDSIRCSSWAPFESVIIDFLTGLEENKKIALFEKRKTLLEYQSLCAPNADAKTLPGDYGKAVSTALQILKPSH
ncbi:hypothetical protein [Flavisolibacter nicotianae]|uniref:hypothetical protein n=1 Tax=Flavisolibacter nicotianae TaxID=2364882 RepID=UPI000EB2F80D|nr:hypothetical protein [Flavisolibacter nicotianae]